MSGIAIPSYASLAASVRRHQGTAATLLPDDAETKPDVVILACTQCAELNAARHALADQEAAQRQRADDPEISLAKANRTLAYYAKWHGPVEVPGETHPFTPGPTGSCDGHTSGTECGKSYSHPVHRTSP